MPAGITTSTPSTIQNINVDVDQIADHLSGTTGIASFPAAAAAANNVSIAEVVRHISEKQLPRVVTKSTGSMASGYGTADSPVTIFTVTGDVLVRLVASVDVAVTSTSNTGTLAVGIAGNTAALLAQTTVDASDFAIGDIWVDNDPATGIGLVPGSGSWYAIGNGADIIVTIATNDMTAGDIDFHLLYIPLSSDGAVVAA